MKTKLYMLILILFISQYLIAQTFVDDKQEVSGIWDTIGSPYIILGEAIIPENETLKIEPGVEIKFKTGNDRDYFIDGIPNPNFNIGFMRVNGTLEASGEQESFITFTRNDNFDNWGVVFFGSTSKNNLLKYCKFEYGYFVRYVIENDNATGVVSFNSSTAKVENCIFINNGWTAINCKNYSNPKIKKCVVYKNEYGIECNTNSKPAILNTIIWENKQAFFINTGANPSISYSLIQGKRIPEEINDKGENIMDKNPKFTNPQEGDFSLQEKSPCLFSGKRAKDMGAIKKKRGF
jgi:hypothetical protein